VSEETLADDSAIAAIATIALFVLKSKDTDDPRQVALRIAFAWEEWKRSGLTLEGWCWAKGADI
jgi:hypothetical protein